MQNDSLDQLSNYIKILSVDAIEKANSGHPGMPMGFAQVMTNLVFNFLKFNPNDPKWPNRDRLVLSAGHGSMLLYSFFYLTGYKNFTLEDIKNFRQLNSKAAGHPESHLYEAIETTTGPLGQGIANAVGMAIAEKKLKAKLGSEICDYKIYVIVGDGCLMEGIAYEAMSLAGHLKLDNLVILFDDNNITIDGKTSLSVSEDHLKKFTAMGFATKAADGHNQEDIFDALSWANKQKSPCFIAFKTVIAKGSKTKENSSKAHGSPLGVDEISYFKNNINYPDQAFTIKDELLSAWRNAWQRNQQDYNKWYELYHNLDIQQKNYLVGKTIEFPKIDLAYDEAEATRVSSGKIISQLLKYNDKMIIGSADLAGSNNLINPNNLTISHNDFSGNFINYGIREHAMAGIMNGLSLSGFTPFGGSFLVFSDYMRPAIRLSALMQLQIIYIMTHDSIGVGEDGPTHQPIEHLASFRAMPGINLFRPADFIETQECYNIALETHMPAIFALSRQKTPQIRKCSEKNLSKQGGYIISQEHDKRNLQVTIFASGTEVDIALQVQDVLQTDNISVRVCSVPSMCILLNQSSDYINYLRGNAQIIVAIEAATEFGWHKIIGSQGVFFGVNQFGASAPSSELYKLFNLTKGHIADKIRQLLSAS
ncbi:MAG: transketolase [Rickettsiaceae bacterium]|nr:transketolase [Rickettsiaceae bacterium]